MRRVRLSDQAYSLLKQHKKPNETFGEVILRFVPRPIRTFGDLERHLEMLEGPLNLDFVALERIRSRKRSLRAWK